MENEAPPVPHGPVRDRDGIMTYEARTGNGARLLVKRLAAATSADPLLQKRFAREKRLAQTLQHPAIAHLRGAGGDWFACEFLEDGLDRPDIANRYRSGTAIRSLIGALAALLAFLHGRGIAHGDIKPAHIRFRRNQPVLVDFGIATVGENDPLSGGEIVGTPRWMAPEQMRAGTITPETDIWSLSSVGLWLCQGRLPIAGSYDEVLTKRDAGIHHEFDLSAYSGQVLSGGHTDALAALLARGLTLEPQRRPTAALLAGALLDQSITSVTAG